MGLEFKFRIVIYLGAGLMCYVCTGGEGAFRYMVFSGGFLDGWGGGLDVHFVHLSDAVLSRSLIPL